MCNINRNTEYAMNKLRETTKLDKREVGILLSRDCVITETYTGKTYKYRIYNYITGETKYLGYKKEAMDVAKYINLLKKVAEQTFYNITYPVDGEELIDYIFTTVFKSYGFKIRKEQVDLSKHMYRAMIGKMILLSDVAVGLGKTHAYLVASIVCHITYEPKWNEQITGRETIVISTSSKRLQREIVREYLPQISKMLLEHGIIDNEILAVTRKGKENYICDTRLNNYVKSLKNKNPEEYKDLVELMNSSTVDLSNVDIRHYDIERIKVVPKHCKSCPRDNICRYKRMLKLSSESSCLFQVTNHHYMIADAKKRIQAHKPLLSEYKAVIYDEAHKVVDAFVSMVSVEICKADVLELIKIANEKKGHVSQAKKFNQYCIKIYKLINDIFSIATKHIDILNDDEVKKYPISNKRIIKSKLLELKKLARQAVIRVEDKKRLIQIGFEKLGESLEVMINDSIMWIENPTNKNLSLCAIPRNIDDIINDTLFKSKVPIVMTSGTLAVNGNFDYTKRTLGLTNATNLKEICKLSPFDYYNNTLLYQERNLPYPNNRDDKYIKKLSYRIVELIKVSYGHALILFTSYEVMRKIYGILKKKNLRYPVFQLSKGNGLAINKYRQSRNGVLLGCGGIWEGVDFAGDILSNLIIVKLPFQVPDPIMENHKKQFENDEGFKREILIPQMLTKLSQGYGRAIRSDTDTAVISILDIRANHRYRESVINVLPKCRVTHKIEDIKTFIREKKTPEYFL